ncbi:MAG TPA: (2Fe-2S) ferredoxin domain-containing protein [Vicinamibacterales bacterium]|nr:(2Fe-2S) ferredoxin domain-containing protein [Vicinamibacterales bacterium]HPK71801.1 (2Fe-2S) ferredoxin domain-containing protein [Vicinamibacterales bacterium]
MPRLTIDDLKKLREQAAGAITLRSGAARARVTIHMGTCGIAAGAREVMAALLKEIEAQGVTDVIVTTSGCAGLCSREPMATVELRSQAPVKYVNLTPDGMVRVFRAHVLGGEVVTESALAAGCETTG